MKHHENCDVNDRNPEGIRKPCNCGASRSEGATSEPTEPPVRLLLRSMIAAMDRGDFAGYWLLFERLMDEHKKAIG